MFKKGRFSSTQGEWSTKETLSLFPPLPWGHGPKDFLARNNSACITTIKLFIPKTTAKLAKQMRNILATGALRRSAPCKNNLTHQISLKKITYFYYI